MLESLLKSDTIPYDLKEFVQEKSEGNPFYLEELVNSLIDSKTLIRDNGKWKLTKSFDELNIPSTINGVISSRLDRLGKEAKRILQEASVIGRAFLFEILRKVTKIKQDIDRSIRGLEQLDLIRARSFEPDLEYIFKHALTQEVAYNGLLKKERQIMHERIGLVMEKLFQERLPEFYETLAFHFKESKSVHKAVDYLSRSGEKSFRKSAIEEANRYFKDAFDILSKKSIKTKEEEQLLIELLIKWALVFRWSADFQGLTDLFMTHLHIVESLDDKEQLGVFYACLGYSLGMTGKLNDSYRYLLEAFRLCEQVGNHEFMGYSCAWLTYTCSELGLLEDAIRFGKRGQEISTQFEWDSLLFSETFGYSALARQFRGEIKQGTRIGNALIEKGRKHFDDRVTSVGFFYLASAHFIAGDFPSTIKLFHQAIKTTKDPTTSHSARMFLGWAYLSNGQVLEAEDALNELTSLAESLGGWTVRKATEGFLALILLSKGDLAKGMSIIDDLQQFHLKNDYRYRYATFEYMLGRFYLQIVQRAGPKSLSLIAKNIGFLIKNVPFADKKAESNFNQAIEVAKEIGAKGILGQAYLYLGLLHKAKNRTSLAKGCISEAIKVFELYGAEIYLQQAKEALASLG
jgi:tetratricopeptide (TPR) repeat protein